MIVIKAARIMRRRIRTIVEVAQSATATTATTTTTNATTTPTWRGFATMQTSSNDDDARQQYQYTDEQLNVIESTGDMKVNAVAGSGKTAVLIEYAKQRPTQKILYVAFNRTVKEEAEQKFAAANLHSARAVTAHGLAYAEGPPFQIKKGNPTYNAFDVHDVLAFDTGKGQIGNMAFGKHVVDLVSKFCNSDTLKMKDVTYAPYPSDEENHTLFSSAHELLSLMYRGKIGCTHDFYLKMYQISQPNLRDRFDTILFDEGQDASPVMLDIFQKQVGATQIIVGDSHQQIYGWRHAIDAMQLVDFPNQNLSTSFRFNTHIASLATEIAKTKKHLMITPNSQLFVTLHGEGKHKQRNTHAVLGRTNSGLLEAAIDFIADKNSENNGTNVHFEGGIDSYSFAENNGGSLYDIMSLYRGNRKYIKSPEIASFRSITELAEYAEITADTTLISMIRIVQTYGTSVPALLKKLKGHHVENKENADRIFSTVHKAKGMEYDEVTLLDDFIGEDRLRDIVQNDTRGVQVDKDKLMEETNILYVAATRTRNHLNIPRSILPLSMKLVRAPNINVI